MATKAAIYLRVSTDEQVSGYGLDAQLAKCEAMATVKGWVPSCVFSDEGISGTKDEKQRPGLAAMLEAIKVGEINAIIIAALDRLGRSTRLILRLVDDIVVTAKCEIVSCKESFDTSTPTGALMLTIFAAMAQWEKDTIKQRTTDGRNARGKIDGEKGGRVPMGYTRTMDASKATGEITTVDEEARIVRTIYDRRARGATLTAIANELNAGGITTRRGRQWHASSVREVLLNEAAYRGGPRNGSGRTWPVVLEA